MRRGSSIKTKNKVTEQPLVLPINKKLINKLITSSIKQLFQYLPIKLKELGYQVVNINTNSYIYAPGTIPIMLVAHIDTVFNKPPQTRQIQYDNNILYSSSKTNGIGADDRAGIYSILEIVRGNSSTNKPGGNSNIQLPHILFTTDEEIGGLGAKIATKELNPDIKYIIELDRKGKNDCVFYDCHNEEFISYIESFGFKYAYGSYSDISKLCPIWNIAGVNLSIGYYNQHTSNEYLNITEMSETIEKVKLMINNLPDNTFQYYTGNSTYYCGGNNYYISNYKTTNNKKSKRKYITLTRKYASDFYYCRGNSNYYTPEEEMYYYQLMYLKD